MATIPGAGTQLTSTGVTLVVDDEDLDLLNDRSWTLIFNTS